MPIFAGGRNRALAESAQAEYGEAVADHRGRVLLALREVEDSLSGLRTQAQQAREQQQATLSAPSAAVRRALPQRFCHYFELIGAERSLLAARRAATQVERDCALATAGLIRALSGGWGGQRPGALAAAQTCVPDYRAGD